MRNTQHIGPAALALAALAFLGLTGPALSQPAPPTGGTAAGAPEAFTLPEVTVTAGRTPERLDRIPQSVTVLTRPQIERTNPAGVLDVLRQVPGISISRAGGLGGQINLRGFNSNDQRSPIFIDGDRFRGRNTLEYLLIDPEDIERIEVIRGPAAALYGSEAVTGLVNVVTRRNDADPSGPFRFTGFGSALSYGSAANSASMHLDANAAGGGFDVRLGLNARRADDYSSPNGTIPNSSYKTLGGSVAVGYTLAPGQRIELSGRTLSVTEGRAGGIGGSPGAPLVILKDADIQVRTGRLAYTGDFGSGLFSRLEADVYVNDFYTKQVNTNLTNPRSLVQANTYVLGPTVVGGRVVGTMPFGSLTVTTGVDGFGEMRPGSEGSTYTTSLSASGGATGTSFRPRNQNAPYSSQTDVGAFIHAVWNLDPAWTLSASGRVDMFQTRTDMSPLPAPALLAAYQANSDVTTDAETGSLGAIYRPLPWLDLVGNVGSTFRVPSVVETFSSSLQGSGYLVPNPGLKSERGVTVEGGFRLHGQTASAKFTVFHSTYRDLILAVPITYLGLPSTQRQNMGRAEINGIEIDGAWQPTPALNLFGNVTLLSATNTSTDAPLPFVAPVHGRLGIRYAPPEQGYSLTAATDWALQKRRVDPKQEFPTGGYAILNLYAQFELDKLVSTKLGNSQVILGAENLLDTSYRNAATFANVSFGKSNTNPLLEPGRNFTVTFRNRF